MEPSALVLLLGLILLVAKQGLAEGKAPEQWCLSPKGVSKVTWAPERRTCGPPWRSSSPACTAAARTQSSSASHPSSAAEKPGWCPLGGEQGVPAARAFCLSDASCPGSEKCCKIGTLRICAQPALVSPGYCPKPCMATEEPCLVSCLDDTWCGPGEKCCHRDCHSRCEVAEPGKPGVCPLQGLRGSLGPCLGPALQNCSDDFDCEAAKKCCATGCSQVCKEPEEGQEVALLSEMVALLGRDGVCAEKGRSEEGGLLRKRKPQGKHIGNADMPCATGAKHRMPGSCVRPGACPPRAAKRGALECGPTFCVRDQDCPKPHEKCCRLHCGWVCTAPVTSGAAGIPAAELLQREMESPGDPEKASGTLLNQFRENKAHE
ncbi:hypothetical protein lerEdw1_005025 [Lerista edwardsae]|nr:hypothetical protein lerEdw1_005025 [Lerista edwardsae]